MGQVSEAGIDLSGVDETISHHGTRADVAIPILQELQQRYGYLPGEALRYLAEQTECTPSQLYGIVTFYSQFRLKPVGKHIVRVCHGTACHVQGAEHISQVISDILKVGDGETTEDGLYTVESVACLGCCSLSPVLMIDDTVYGRLTRAEVQKIFKQRARQEKTE
jgi:NADH:ubiquinone oxidoreductase subunit E